MFLSIRDLFLDYFLFLKVLTASDFSEIGKVQIKLRIGREKLWQQKSFSFERTIKLFRKYLENLLRFYSASIKVDDF